MAKSLSSAQVLGINNKTVTLSGEWAACVGEMARHGVVFIWGNSGNGKTSAIMSGRDMMPIRRKPKQKLSGMAC